MKPTREEIRSLIDLTNERIQDLLKAHEFVGCSMSYRRLKRLESEVKNLNDKFADNEPENMLIREIDEINFDLSLINDFYHNKNRNLYDYVADVYAMRKNKNK